MGLREVERLLWATEGPRWNALLTRPDPDWNDSEDVERWKLEGLAIIFGGRPEGEVTFVNQPAPVPRKGSE